MSIVCAVLAAGASKRLGYPKQLLPWFEHGNLVQHAVSCAEATSATRVAVVIGAHADRIEQSLRGRPVDFVRSDWERGLAASVHAAVNWAIDCQARALLLSVCDQPYLETRQLDRVIGFSRLGTRLTASEYGSVLGVPALFPERYFPQLLKLQGDQGASQVLRAEPDVFRVDWPEGQYDIDTLTDIVRTAARRWPERRAWAMATLRRATT